MLGIPKENTGRTGLGDIDVTPVMYLHLCQQLAKPGHNVPYRKAQLDLALAAYLRENKGAWKREQSKDIKGLEEFAIQYVQSERQKIQNLQKNSSAPLSVQEKKAMAMMEARGVAPLKSGDLPKNLQGQALTDGQETERNLSRVETSASLAHAMLEIATYAEPGTATAAVVLATRLAPDVAMAGGELLLKKLEKRAETPEEEGVCVAGFNEVAGTEEKSALAGPLSDVQSKVKDPGARLELLGLNPAVPAETLITIVPLNTPYVPVRMADFKDNTHMTGNQAVAHAIPGTRLDAPPPPGSVPHLKPTPPSWASTNERDS